MVWRRDTKSIAIGADGALRELAAGVGMNLMQAYGLDVG